MYRIGGVRAGQRYIASITPTLLLLAMGGEKDQ